MTDSRQGGICMPKVSRAAEQSSTPYGGLGGQRIVAGGDAREARPIDVAGGAHDVLGELEPCRFAGSRHVVDAFAAAEGAAVAVELEGLVDDRDGGRGEVAAPGGRSALIVDDAQLVALPSQAQHGAHEVAAPAAVDPARADDDGRRAAGEQGLLAVALGAPVDAEGIGLVVRAVRGRTGAAVEHVVRREVDDRGAGRGRRLRERCRSHGVDHPGEVRLRLGTVHVRIGGGVDHQVRPVLGDRPAQCRLVAQVHVRPVTGDQTGTVGQQPRRAPCRVVRRPRSAESSSLVASIFAKAGNVGKLGGDQESRSYPKPPRGRQVASLPAPASAGSSIQRDHKIPSEQRLASMCNS